MLISSFLFAKEDDKTIDFNDKFADTLSAEDDYDLWLRYVKVQDSSLLLQYRKYLTQIVVLSDSPRARATKNELQLGLSGLLDCDISLASDITLDGAVVVATPASFPDEIAPVDGGGIHFYK